MKDIKATVRLSEKTLKALKVKTAQNGATIQQVLSESVEAYLKAPRASGKAQ